MCGRYTIKNPAAVALAYAAAAKLIEATGARFNIVPSQSLPVVTKSGAASMTWGLIPYWETSTKPKIAPTNARSEEALQKSIFRPALQKRRCLVLADGFYEWRRIDQKTKVPHHIQMRAGRPFAIAGIYEEATELRPATFALLTTRPNALMTSIHDRMPLILSPEGEARWLDDQGMNETTLNQLATPYPADEMEAFTVAPLINNPRNDFAACVKPVAFEEDPCLPW